MAEDAEGKLVAPGDLAAQARQAFANVGLALAAAGARPEQVARITIYVVDHRPEYLPDISAARIAVFGDHRPADTLLGVETLAEPGYLIEVDAIAVVDNRESAARQRGGPCQLADREHEDDVESLAHDLHVPCDIAYSSSPAASRASRSSWNVSTSSRPR